MPCAVLATECGRWLGSVELCSTSELSGTDLVKTTREAALSLGAIVPLLVHDTEGQILVRRPCDEPNKARVLLASRCKGLASPAAVLAFDLIRGRLCLVDEVWVENVELVALHDLWWRVVVVVVRLVVLVPLVAHLHTIEIAGLPGLVRASPLWLRSRDLFFGREDFLALFYPACDLAFVEGHSCPRIVFFLDGRESRCADCGRAATGWLVGGRHLI